MPAQSDDLNVQGQLPTVIMRTKGPISFSVYDLMTKTPPVSQLRAFKPVLLTKCDDGTKYGGRTAECLAA